MALSKGLLTDAEFTALRAKPPASVPSFSEELAGLGETLSRVAETLRQVLEYNRVHAIKGFKRGRCKSCDVPHLTYRWCPCPHHQAAELLRSLGVEIDVE